jgi:hypothetical protein
LKVQLAEAAPRDSVAAELDPTFGVRPLPLPQRIGGVDEDAEVFTALVLPALVVPGA